MAIFLTSDTHFRHKNILEYCGRPFFSMEHMERELIRNWNSVVGVDDTVYHLGDFSMNHKYHADIVPQLNGKKILVLGNHDKSGPGCGSSKFNEMKPTYLSYSWYDVVLNTILIHPDLGEVNLSHFPTIGGGDHGEERFTKHRLPSDTKYVLCGHVHENWKKNKQCINVGVDVWDYRPVEFNMVCELFIEGNIDEKNNFKRKAFKLLHKIKNRIKGIKPFRLSSKAKKSRSNRSRRSSR